MDPMVIKYLAIAAVVYGTQAALAISQILLCLYLITTGLLHLSAKENLGKWAQRFGLIINPNVRKNKGLSVLMVGTGVSFILPLLGLSYWITVLACLPATYCILTLTNHLNEPIDKKYGNAIRKGLALSSIVILGFTLWEGRDLIYAGFDVNYKAIYWRNAEVTVWQNENNPNAPKIGEMAPDFELMDYTGTKSTRLSDFRGKKPVVLFFGSFT